ncbi:MAG: hypothetical protein AB7O28_15255 [Vicinamibacterales bacterium]
MKAWLVRFGLVAIATGAALALAEGVVRWVDPYAKDSAIPGHVFAIDDVLGWRFRPGVVTTHRTRHFTVEYRIDASGYRDGHEPGRRAASTRRALLYGDSLMFGWGIPQDRRFSDLLEARVPNLEFWNRAVPGYGLDQELLAYEHDAGTTTFDAAVFFVSRGTLDRMRSGFIYAKYKPRFVLAGGGLRLVPPDGGRNRLVSLVYDALSPFYLPYFLQERISLVRQRAAGAAPPSFSAATEPRYLDELALSALRRAREGTRRRGHRMSIVVGDIFFADRELLRAFCRDHDIAFLEVPMEIARTARTDERMDLVLGPYDRHWNTTATALVADAFEAHARELAAGRRGRAGARRPDGAATRLAAR